MTSLPNIMKAVEIKDFGPPEGLQLAERSIPVRSDGEVLQGFAVTPENYSNTEALGAVLYTEHVYAFEIASVILLLAIVAAITLTMRKRPGLKALNIAEQVAVDA